MMRYVESGATGAVELVEVIETPYLPPPVFVDSELEIQPDQGGKQEDEDEEEVQLFYQVPRA